MSTFGPNSAYINELYFEYLKNPNAFDETWGRFKSRIRPTFGDQDHGAGGPTDTGYYDYFNGDNATLVYGYGGFQVSNSPPPRMLAIT